MGQSEEVAVTPGQHWEEAGVVQEVVALARSPVVEEMLVALARSPVVEEMLVALVMVRSPVVEEMPVEVGMASVRSLAAVGTASPAVVATETEEEGTA
jgi:hypothetical protein